jgi:hypothetical protein
MSYKIPKAGRDNSDPCVLVTGQPTRREHATAGVVDGGKVVTGAARAAIAGHGGGRDKRTQREFAPHPSTSLSQISGDPARGFSSTNAKLAPHPIVASNPTGKPTKAPAVAWGMRTRDLSPHDPAHGDAVLREAAMCGSAQMPGECHHSICKK